MSGVLGRPTLSRQDLIISTVSDQSIGFRWWQSPDGGSTREPVNLTGYTGVAELRGVDGTLWATLPLTLATQPADPYGALNTTPNTFTDPAWRARSNGEYAFLLTSPDGVVTVMATGYLYLER